MALVGERAYQRYIKHPSASSTSWLANGWPIDSGTAMLLLSNNTHHLEIESQRTLVQSPGPGQITNYANAAAVLGGVDDFPNPANTNSFNQSRLIPWGRATAARFGPFFLIEDRDTATDPGPLGRAIDVQIDATIDAAATFHYGLFALTWGTDPPFGDSTALYAETDFGGTGNRTSRATLRLTAPAATSTSQNWPCRYPGGTGEAPSVTVTPFWLWFGWRIFGAGVTASYINSFSAYEVPE